jgi:hypothetical protein
MRLHKHDEVVEAMARVIYRHPIESNDGLVWSQQLATAAMLEAVVRMDETIEPGDPCFVIPLERQKP